MTIRTISRMIFLLLSATWLAAACGQKGPLYLPGNPSEIKTEVPAAESQADDEEEGDDADYETEPQSD
jgi:predicted small lipoprotein YifL